MGGGIVFPLQTRWGDLFPNESWSSISLRFRRLFSVDGKGGSEGGGGAEWHSVLLACDRSDVSC